MQGITTYNQTNGRTIMDKGKFLNYLHNADKSDLSETQDWFHGYAMCLHDVGSLTTNELVEISDEITKSFEGRTNS